MDSYLYCIDELHGLMYRTILLLILDHHWY